MVRISEAVSQDNRFSTPEAVAYISRKDRHRAPLLEPCGYTYVYYLG